MKTPEWLFREAVPASFLRNYLKTLGQTAVFWGFFLWMLPWLVSIIERRLGLPQFEARPWLGTIGFIAFGTLGLASGYTMAKIGQGTPLPLDSPRNLVVAGPYRWVRNPMAVAGLSQAAMTSLWFGSPSVLAYVIAGALLWNYVIRPPEEADLADRFGDSFHDYERQVRCWLPNLRPYTPA